MFFRVFVIQLFRLFFFLASSTSLSIYVFSTRVQHFIPDFCCVGIRCSQWTSGFDSSKHLIIYPTNLKCLSPFRIKLNWSTHTNVFARPCYPFIFVVNRVHWFMSKTSNLAWFLCSLEIHRTNNISQENEMVFQSFECFSKTNIDVEITRSFQFIYVFINLKNRSDHWLGIKPKVQISDQNKHGFVQAAVKVDYKENWISALTTLINTLVLWILSHEIVEILNLHLRCSVFPLVS